MASTAPARWIEDIRGVMAGKGASSEKRTTTIMAVALLAAVAPLDISQLFFLVLGGVAYALLQPVAVPAPASREVLKPRAPAQAARPSGAAAPAKYVPPALRQAGRARPLPTVPDRRSLAPPAAEPAAPDASRTVKPVAAPTFSASSWDAQVDQLVADMLPTAAGDQAMDLLAASVRRSLASLVPAAEVVGLSSSAPNRGRAFGVAVPDADVVVSCDPTALAKCLHAGCSRGASAIVADRRQLQKLALRAITERLVASGEFRFRRSAFAANEPKVTLLPVGEGAHAVPVDITVNSATPLHNAALLRECGRLDARAHALALLVRRWARDRGISHTAKGHLSPYGWTLMTIYFLQVGFEDGAVLPALDGFRLSSVLAGAPSKQAASSLPCTPRDLSVGDLFREFISFFHNKFDVRNEAVSVRAGRRAEPSLALPLHIVLSSPEAAPLVGLNIEDPFDPKNNVGTTLTALGMSRWREEFSRAAALCGALNPSLTSLLDPWAPEESATAE